jgi:hypothetical protein
VRGDEYPSRQKVTHRRRDACTRVVHHVTKGRDLSTGVNQNSGVLTAAENGDRARRRRRARVVEAGGGRILPVPEQGRAEAKGTGGEGTVWAEKEEAWLCWESGEED